MRSIRYSKAHEETVKRIGGELFDTMREFVCFAAMLGFELDRREVLGESETEVIDGRIFGNHQPAIEVLDAIGLAHSKELDIFNDGREEELLTCFEEFANGGLSRIEEILESNPGDIKGIDTLIDYIIYDYMKNDLKDVNTDVHDIEF